jgi:hypothetical protein
MLYDLHSDIPRMIDISETPALETAAKSSTLRKTTNEIQTGSLASPATVARA